MKEKESLERNEEKIKVPEEKAANLLSLVILLSKTFLEQKYKPNELFGKSIILSVRGNEILEKLRLNGYEEELLIEMKLALLINSPENIDIENINIEELFKILSSEIIERKLFFPYVFGRELYDAYFENFKDGSNPDEESTLELLKKSPIGIFQIYKCLVGPFGLLESTEIRNIRPNITNSYPLKHSSDTSDNSIRRVKLIQSRHTIQDIDKDVFEIQKQYGEDQKYDFKIPENYKKFDLYDYNKIEDLPFLIGGFPVEELRVLLAELINCNGQIRKKFPKGEEFKFLREGSGQKISSLLSHNECMQLILLFENQTIIKCLERIIFENTIHIPETEIREAKYTLGRKRFYSVKTQCSKYGFRSIITINKETNTAIIRLRNLIKNLYSDKDEYEKLAWKLRHVNGKNIHDKLGSYLLLENPREIIENLVFDNAKYVNETFKYLKYGDFEEGTTQVIKEDYYINKILWKLGFEINVFPTYQKVFWKREAHFINTVRSSNVFNEQEKEMIRSAGVNYFVSLEEILDYGISFIGWALLSDHYSKTNFVFNLEDAREFTVEIINKIGYSIGENDILVLDKEGKNTLYPLVKSFSVLADFCEEILSERSNHKRLISDYPDFFGKTDIYEFPFKHKILLLDLNEEDLKKLIGILKKISSILESNNVSNVRNRIKHNRPSHEFPTTEELEGIHVSVEEVVEEMEREGILPTVYVNSGNEIDEFGRGFIKYKNYKSEILLISNSSNYIKSGMPLYKKLQINLPNVHIKDSFEKLRFKYVEKTLYSMYWKDYPRRRKENQEEYEEEKTK